MTTCHDNPLLYFDGKFWVTWRSVCCLWNGVLIEVPAGFRTDLATVPFPFTAITHRYGPFNRAVILHDFIYANNGWINEDTKMTRSEADNLMYSLMLEDGTPRWKATLMWAAVRANPQVWGRF